MIGNPPQHLSRSHIVYALAAALWLYVVARVVSVQFTIDECASWLWFHNEPEWKILNLSLVTANNHVPNTLLMKWLGNFFGPHEVVLRLPALIGAVLYLWFAARLAKGIFSQWWLQVAGFALLVCNPYLLDFLGLARGYALSLGLEMLSLFYLWRYVRESRFTWASYSLLGAMGAAFANFSALNFLAATAVTVLLLTPLGVWRTTRRWGAAFAFLLGVFVLIVRPLLKLANSSELYFGGEKGFIADTLQSLTANFLYRNDYDGDAQVQNLTWSVVCVCIVAIIIAFVQWTKNGFRWRSSPEWLFALIPVIAIALILVQHYVLKAKFPISRAALYLYPVTVLFILLVISSLLKNRNWTFGVILSGLGALFAHNFLTQANLSIAKSWDFEKYSREALRAVEASKPTDLGRGVTLGAHPLLGMSLEFYRQQRQLDWINPISYERIDTSKHYQFIFTFQKDTAELRKGFEEVFSKEEFVLVRYPIDKQ